MKFIVHISAELDETWADPATLENMTDDEIVALCNEDIMLLVESGTVTVERCS